LKSGHCPESEYPIDEISNKQGVFPMDDAKNRTKSVSLCTPGVRMMVLRAYAFQEDDGKLKQVIETIPVVALSARIYPEHDTVGCGVILCDDAYGIITLDDFKEFYECYGDGHTIVELVAAPRPMEENGREQHEAFLDAAMHCKGKVMISGYPSELYDGRLAGWNRRVFDLPNNAAGGVEKRRMTEVLWMNYA
jgi:hypothetical protein